MSIQLQAKSLVEHLRHICERPRMFAPDFEIGHLLMFIHGYEAALRDAGLPSQHDPLREWVYQQHPEWRYSSMSWPGQVLVGKEGELEQSLDIIIALLDGFTAQRG
jgi:hypothetical protein